MSCGSDSVSIVDDASELSDAVRRGTQRAAVHLMKAAIEVVAGIGAFLEEMGKNSGDEAAAGDQANGDPQHFAVE